MTSNEDGDGCAEQCSRHCVICSLKEVECGKRVSGTRYAPKDPGRLSSNGLQPTNTFLVLNVRSGMRSGMVGIEKDRDRLVLIAVACTTLSGILR